MHFIPPAIEAWSIMVISAAALIGDTLVATLGAALSQPTDWRGVAQGGQPFDDLVDFGFDKTDGTLAELHPTRSANVGPRNEFVAVLVLNNILKNLCSPERHLGANLPQAQYLHLVFAPLILARIGRQRTLLD
jgi:hypothetical protein